jgi:DNA polymerase I
MKKLVQILDVDYFVKDGRPIIRIFGKQENGQALCGFYEGFRPYFYTEKNDATALKLKELRLEHEEVERKLPFGYRASTTPVYKVTVENPQDVPRLRATLEQCGRCYEADVLFKYRFMVDNGLRGMRWAELEGETVHTSAAKVPGFKVRSISPVQNTANPPMRYLCIDIECLQSDLNRAPDAARDPIIAVGLAFLPTHRNYQSLVLLAKPAGGDATQCFRGEKELLEALSRIIAEFDPDVITGYNINGFDVPYLLDRFKKFGLSTALGRSDKPVQSKTFAGSQETEIAGRVAVDVYQLLKRDTSVRLHRYNLDTAAKALIGQEKVAIKHTEIPTMWAKDIPKFIAYTRKDALLALQILLERRMLDKFIEIAKIAGPLLQDCLKGQTVRIENMVLHEFKRRGMIMPGRPSDAEAERRSEEKIKGGAVLEPKRGLHVDTVLVLDFQALYPSIIKTFNVSVDALLTDDNGNPPTGELKHNTAPNGARFVDSSIYEGVFPALIKNLLIARLEAKRAMKNASGDERRVLDAKQYALKILANSFYGYCGYARARLFKGEVASAITAYGRENIERTKSLIENTFGAKVIYGDTDSLFIKVATSDLNEAQRIGEEIAAAASKKIGLHLEFEKIYKSFLILTKKRYAGWKFERKGEIWEDTLDMRGIETVRRDWCTLVSDVMLDVLNIVLKERDVGKAAQHVKGVLRELSAGQVPVEKLTIVKGITRALDAYDGIQPHVELARKMQKRDPTTSPKVGDRVGYVIIRGKDLLSRRAEDPEYARQKGLQLDVEYYVNSQLLPPIERIFEVLGVEKGELLGGGKQVSMFDFGAAGQQSVLACESCGRAWRRQPLSGKCECGGTPK